MSDQALRHLAWEVATRFLGGEATSTEQEVLTDAIEVALETQNAAARADERRKAVAWLRWVAGQRVINSVEHYRLTFEAERIEKGEHEFIDNILAADSDHEESKP